MNKDERLDEHQKFRELAALAQRGALTDSERLALDRHLARCLACQEAHAEFALISAEGMPLLAAAYSQGDAGEDWDEQPGRNRLLARIAATQEFGSSGAKAQVLPMRRPFFSTPFFSAKGLVAARWPIAVAAIVLVTVALGGYHLGGRMRPAQEPALPAFAAPAPELAAEEQENENEKEKKTADDVIALNAQLSRVELQVSAGQQEIARLREALHGAENHAAALSNAKLERDAELRQVSEQRDKLAGQLHEAEQSYQLVQAELTTLRAEHERALVHTTSLETKVDELSASSRDQERRLRDDEQYLSSDRDIRELMGARKLYIADVFDVDSGSRTRKPFGRVFYTENKSLIFYAFDLDHEPGVKNASAFQVWGQRDAGSGEKDHATNLGILYMDSESNRRWVLRLDDPKQLAEIDAVFVTVEPHGGSQKPTNKPFLYALLRREANHP
jgi:hypothetical protein